MKRTTKRPAKKTRPPITSYQTRMLEGATLAGFAFVIGSIFLISSLQNFLLQTNQFASVVSSVLVDLTNGDRVANNLGGLTVNATLVKAAQAKADDMAAKSYFAHRSPEGLDSWYWFEQAGYDYQHAGENLAVDFSDSTDVERAWMNSPTHRENILNGKYTEIGIATASGYYQGRPTTFVVQMFGTPRGGTTIAKAPTPQQAQEETAVALEELSVPDVLGSAIDTEEAPTAPAKAGSASGAKVEKVADIDADKKPIGAIVREAPEWQILATSPSTSMRYSYYLLAMLVLLALAVDTGLELKWHHRKRAATAGALLAVMAGLFFYADYTMFDHAKVAEIHTTMSVSL